MVPQTDSRSLSRSDGENELSHLMVILPILSKYLGHTGVLSGCVFPEIGGELLEETD